MICSESKIGRCDLTGCYHYKKHKKDDSCDGKNRCHYHKPCVKSESEIYYKQGGKA